MVYTIYRTLNIVNGKYYLGKHQTENPNDDYLGSGSAIKAAIKKYGRASFTKEVLFVFDNEHEMNLKERELITEELVADKNSYNKGIGGEGGPHFKGKTHTKETIEKFSNSMRGRKLSDTHRLSVSNSLKGHKLSNETKEKLSKKQKDRYKREKRII
jgi:hypothetical protein